MAKNIEVIIKKAVNEGIEAGRRLSVSAPYDAYKAVERRLRALPDLKDKVKEEREYLEDLLTYGLPKHSNDIIRFKRSGVRLSDEEILEALIMDLKASIAANEHEIKTVEDALEVLKTDPYYPVIKGKYFEQLSDEVLAEELFCDASTVRRNKARLVRRLAVRLYGVKAL